MRKLVCALLALLAALTLCACAEKSADKSKEVQSETLYVKKVDGLSDDFILGMDASSVIAEERSGVKYYNFNGEEQDVFQTLAENGVTHIRVRVWNHPYDAAGHGYGGGNCDIGNAVEIGSRAAKYGMKLIVDFHYSDFWADPGKQMAPLAWKDMSIEEKTEAAYAFTKDCLEQLKSGGAQVGMVQVGNETNGALCGEKTWFNIQYIMQAGARATREVWPDALVAVHFANPEKAGAYRTYAEKLAYYDVDYDVFASSYYPYWHGTLDNLAAVLGEIAETYGKRVMVMETSYAYTAEDTDFSGNTISDGGTITKPWPFTVQGQANAVRSVIDTVARIENGIGVVYWEGTWISVGTSSWEENHALWEQYGSGWASSYAAVYDPDDAGKYYGGCAVDNQALFGPDGHPLESLKVFALVRRGNELPPEIDAIEDAALTVDLAGEISLPETVNAIMTDDSRQAVPVRWNVTEAELAAMYAGGVADYDVTGDANGFPAHCRVSMVEYNFLQNDSFETGDLTGWELTDLAEADELYVEDKLTDSLAGSRHMHFWSAAENSVEFTLEQRVADLTPGAYCFSVSIMGGDSGASEIYAYAKVDGETIGTAPMTITSYGSWDTGVVPDIQVGAGQEVTVGIYVRCQGEGSGAWGKIDCAKLNSQN
ncbi:MAG: glycosyl hydrolase 53 family protein [Oscillospiraceae bacterium]|nr:glycosyl hydrolase 53 family protein [Oscillospiraceae bacterium]